MPAVLVNVKDVWFIITSTILVSVVPESFVNDTESPIFNSSLNLVLKPVTALPETDIEPEIIALSPFTESKEVSAV